MEIKFYILNYNKQQKLCFIVHSNLPVLNSVNGNKLIMLFEEIMFKLYVRGYYSWIHNIVMIQYRIYTYKWLYEMFTKKTKINLQAILFMCKLERTVHSYIKQNQKSKFSNSFQQETMTEWQRDHYNIIFIHFLLK